MMMMMSFPGPVTGNSVFSVFETLTFTLNSDL